MKPLLCVTVTAGTTADLRRRRDSVSDADLVELRLDSVSDPNVAGALEGRRRPSIVTCRPVWEGGQFKGSEEERRRILAEALALGAEYVDVEWRAGFDDLIALTGGRRIVLSMHDYAAMPADLGDSARAMRATGAEVIKIAGTANSLSDCVRLLDIGTTQGKQGGMVLIAMGEQGLASRVLAGRFESSWTYAGALSSVGQLGAATMLEEYRFRSVTETTDVYGVVGSPVAHSVSPAMHNAAFRAARLDAVYLPLRAADAGDFDAFARAIGLKGASVTIPFKVALCESRGRSLFGRTTHRRDQHDPDRQRPLGGWKYGRERISASAAGSVRGAAWHARGDSRRRWRGAGGRDRAGVERRRCPRARARSRARRSGRDDRVRRCGPVAS